MAQRYDRTWALPRAARLANHTRASRRCNATVDADGVVRIDCPYREHRRRPSAIVCQGVWRDGRRLLVPVTREDGRVPVIALAPDERAPFPATYVSCLTHDLPMGAYDAVLLPRRAPVVVSSALALATIGAAIVLSSWGDPDARPGRYEGVPADEVARDLDEEVAWYAMEISVASHLFLDEGGRTVEARIENPAANHCDQRVRIYERGHADDVLYESGAIAPGEYLERIELAHPLAVGIHTLVVEFQGYEHTPTLVSDTGAILGHDTFGAACAAEVTLEVTPGS